MTQHLPQITPLPNRFRADVLARKRLIGLWSSCLLYTSDAADE